jgi:ABC-2 type transport system permease protein
MLRYLRIIGVFARAEAQFELQYRLNFVFGVLQVAIVIGTSLGAVLVLYSYTDTMHGWTLPQMLVLLGTFYLMQGIGEFIFVPSATRFIESVRLGTLDFMLLKPADAQALVSSRHFELTEFAQMALGLLVVGLGLAPLSATLPPFAGLAFALALACGFALIYVVVIASATLAFWFVRVENLLAVYEAFTDAGRFPVDIYPGWLRFTLSSVIPIGIAVTVPAQALSGRLDASGLVLLVGGTVAALAFVRWFWLRGVRSYRGASA